MLTKSQIAETIEASRHLVSDAVMLALEELQTEAARREDDEEKRRHGREQASAQMDSVAAMVAALGVDYDRLEELRDKRNAGAWVAGWNMPGYTPDSEPAAFDTCDEARDYIADSMHDAADEISDDEDMENPQRAGIRKTADTLRDAIGDRDSDYGQTVGRFHYWVTHKPGELADSDEQAELDELEKAAGDCESEEDARQAIEEDALSVEFRSDWSSSRDDMTPGEFRIVLCTGGPHVEIQGDLDEHGQPSRCRLLYSDWFQGLTEYFGDNLDRNALQSYAACFYFGE